MGHCRAEKQGGIEVTELLQSIVVGVITGIFSAGAVWGVLKTEMRWMRRDLDEVREFLWGAKNA